MTNFPQSLKKTIVFLGCGSFLFVIFGIIIIVVVIFSFFTILETDDYVKGNIGYATKYKEILTDNFNEFNGYVSLERITYFSTNEHDFEKLYNDNLNSNVKSMKPIGEVCFMQDYKELDVCAVEYIENSGQINSYQTKIWTSPIDLSKITVTSFFGMERYVFNTYDVHYAWDFAASSQTPVYAVCDGTIETISFRYNENKTNTNGGYGNYIVLRCNYESTSYKVIYAHLYPGSYQQFNIAENQNVVKSQPLAGVGTTGYSTGNHLHFEVQLEDGTQIDGMSLIDFNS